MNKPITAYELSERLRKVWPLPKYISKMSINMYAGGMATVEAEFYIDQSDVPDLLTAVQYYDLVAKSSP